jgi:hypothetical protein
LKPDNPQQLSAGKIALALLGCAQYCFFGVGRFFHWDASFFHLGFIRKLIYFSVLI